MASAMEVAKEIIAINDRLLDEWAERPGYAQMTGCTDDSASLAGARKIDEENAEKEWSDTRNAIYSQAAAMITARDAAIRADEAHKCAERAVGFVNENFTLPHSAVVQEFMDKLRLAIMQGQPEGLKE